MLFSFDALLEITDSMGRVQQKRFQHVARLECDNLTVTVVCRFLYDWMHFSEEVRQILHSSSSTGEAERAPSPPGSKLPQYYRPIVEVLARDSQCCFTVHSREVVLFGFAALNQHDDPANSMFTVYADGFDKCICGLDSCRAAL